MSKLRESLIAINMTENGDPYENAIADRVYGVIKSNFKLNRVFNNHTEALVATDAAIVHYNNLRPHMGCDYITPSKAHELESASNESALIK